MSSDPPMPTGGKQVRRRRNPIINPAFQFKYAVTIMLGVFVGSSFMSFILYGLLYQQARQRVLHLTPTNVMENTYAIILFAAAFSLLMAVALGVWSLIMTHRIGGPLHILQNQLDELTQGRIPKPRRLRKGDEFKELFATFKKFLGSYASRRQSQKDRIQEAMRLLRSLRASGAAPMADIQKIEDQLDQLLAEFACDRSPVAECDSKTTGPQAENTKPEPAVA